MATMKKPSTSSSSFNYNWTHDVFLSFRGADTREIFTRKLYKALSAKNIKTFIDDRGLQKGSLITPALVDAILESRVALVIFSKNYAGSTFCLDELVQILLCSADKGMLVCPIFYEVDPADVRHQRRSYAVALAKHESRSIVKEKIEMWKSALTDAANRSGWHFDGNMRGFIERITNEVQEMINPVRDGHNGNIIRKQPKSQPMKDRGVEHLSDKLINTVNIDDTSDNSESESAEEEEEEEEAERKRKNMPKALFYTIIKVAGDADFHKQIGRDIYFDLVDFNEVRSFQIQSTKPFIHFKEQIARELGKSGKILNFWLCMKRENNAYRPKRPINSEEEKLPVKCVREVSNRSSTDTELKLYLAFLEIPLGSVLTLPRKKPRELLLFFKLYDPSEHQKLRYFGCCYAKDGLKPMDMLEVEEEDGEIELYKEITSVPRVMLEPVDMNTTLSNSQFKDGDIIIICPRRADIGRNGQKVPYPNVLSFLEGVHDDQNSMSPGCFSSSTTVRWSTSGYRPRTSTLRYRPPTSTSGYGPPTSTLSYRSPTSTSSYRFTYGPTSSDRFPTVSFSFQSYHPGYSEYSDDESDTEQ